MNVLIAADMEGIVGIEDCRECLPAYPAAYARGRRLMTDEVLTAIEALRECGAGRISVGDWHMVGTNVERERMPAGVEVRPIAELALNEAEPSIAKAHGGPLDAVVMIGHHASTPNPRAFCSHTFVWEMEVKLDGDSLSEARVYAQALAAEGIPALALSGDHWMLDELAEGEMGGARLIEAMRGEGRARARSRPVEEVQAELREAIGAALAVPPAASARPQLPRRAADPRGGRGDRPRDGRRAGRPAAHHRRCLPRQPGLARVPPAGQALPRRRRLPPARRPSPLRRHRRLPR